MDILLFTLIGGVAAFFTFNPFFLVVGVLLGVVSQGGKKGMERSHQKAMARIETATVRSEANAAMVGSFLEMLGWAILVLVASLLIVGVLAGGGQ